MFDSLKERELKTRQCWVEAADSTGFSAERARKLLRQYLNELDERDLANSRLEGNHDA